MAAMDRRVTRSMTRSGVGRLVSTESERVHKPRPKRREETKDEKKTEATHVEEEDEQTTPVISGESEELLKEAVSDKLRSRVRTEIVRAKEAEVKEFIATRPYLSSLTITRLLQVLRERSVLAGVVVLDWLRSPLLARLQFSSQTEKKLAFGHSLESVTGTKNKRAWHNVSASLELEVWEKIFRPGHALRVAFQVADPNTEARLFSGVFVKQLPNRQVRVSLNHGEEFSFEWNTRFSTWRLVKTRTQLQRCQKLLGDSSATCLGGCFGIPEDEATEVSLTYMRDKLTTGKSVIVLKGSDGGPRVLLDILKGWVIRIRDEEDEIYLYVLIYPYGIIRFKSFTSCSLPDWRSELDTKRTGHLPIRFYIPMYSFPLERSQWSQVGDLSDWPARLADIAISGYRSHYRK